MNPIRLSRENMDLFKPHPYVLWDQNIIGRELRDFISPYSLATYLHVNGAIEMYYMGVVSENTICCKVIDENLLNKLIASIKQHHSRSLYHKLKFKLILWLGSKELLKIPEGE
jgi:hypothetical protein